MLKMTKDLNAKLKSWLNNEAEDWGEEFLNKTNKDKVKVRVQVKYDKKIWSNIISVKCNDNEVYYNELIYYDEGVEDELFGYDVNMTVSKEVKND